MNKKYLTFILLALALSATACNSQSASENPTQSIAGEGNAIEFNNGKEYRVEAPPSNESTVTLNELAELKLLAVNLSNQEVQNIMHWNGTPSLNTNWIEITEELINKYKLGGLEAAHVHAVVSGAIYTSLTATFDGKYEYLRPRPTDLDPTNPIMIDEPAHPSYPAEHTSAAWTAALILSHFFPNEKEMLERTADTVGITQMQAGVQFPSDNEASIKLASAVVKDIVQGLKAKNATQYMNVEEGKDTE